MESTDIEEKRFTLQILEGVEESDADDIEREYITYNISAFNA